MNRRDPSVVATNLRRLRLTRGYGSQAALARQMGTVAESRGAPIADIDSLVSMISRWETGSTRPSTFYVEILCDALRCSRPDLYEPRLAIQRLRHLTADLVRIAHELEREAAALGADRT